MILLRHLRIDAFKHLRNIDLWFPRQGSVLIEGHNESGKSTLFEAIYFALYGKALVGEDSGAPSLESLVPHGESRALVYLAVQVGVTELEITRTLVRSANPGAKAKHDVKLRILRPDRQVETISAISAANDAILNEMNGLDSNVLRNSCLMEQQALDRIESLSRSDRELAIAKLLGIEAIQRIEHDLKVATKDGDALAQAQTRLEVARKYAEAQHARAEAQGVQHALLAARARAALAARDTLAARMRDVEARLAEVEREIVQLRERSQRATTLEALRGRSDETAQLLHDAAQEENALALMRAHQGSAVSVGGIASQLARADSDIKAAEAREREWGATVAATQRHARSSMRLAGVALIGAAIIGAAGALAQFMWLPLLALVPFLAAILLLVRWQRLRKDEQDEQDKLTAMTGETMQLRGKYEAIRQFTVPTGEQDGVTPEALAAQQQKAAVAVAIGAVALRELATEMSGADIAAPTLPSPDEMRRAHETLARSLQAEMARLDIPATQQQFGTLGEVERQARTTWNELTAQRDEERQRLVEVLAEAGIAVTGDEPIDALVADWPALAHAGDPDALAAVLANASAIEGQLRQHVEAQCQQYGFDADTLDAAECQKAYDDLSREQRQRRLAAEMADEVFRRIVQRVLPETEMHMRALLPDLTDGRYRDVTLLGGDENSADLRIRVWDEQAGRYVGKRLFSGGTRDQCSLALRLAFALATLPKELGAMPGFIFLDEPLSSFDDRRSQALVDVLTRGPIAKQFPQVFLISHSQSFDPAAFTCALRMAGGRIATTSLPDEAAARALWDAA